MLRNNHQVSIAEGHIKQEKREERGEGRGERGEGTTDGREKAEANPSHSDVLEDYSFTQKKKT